MTYDQWKCDSGYDEQDDEDEPEFFCTACEDQGWLAYGDDGEPIIPCPECSAPLELDDLHPIDQMERP